MGWWWCQKARPGGVLLLALLFASRRSALPRRGSPAKEPQRRRVISARAANEAERVWPVGGLMVVSKSAPRGVLFLALLFTLRRSVLPRSGSPATEPQRRRVISARAENEAERVWLGGGLMGVLKSAHRGGALFGFAFHLETQRTSEARRPCNRPAKKTEQG